MAEKRRRVDEGIGGWGIEASRRREAHPSRSLGEGLRKESRVLILNPQSVVFGSATLERVSFVVIERVGARVVVEWGDGGPQVVFADVPEQRVNAKVVQDMDVAAVDGPRPGNSGELTFVASMSGADGGTKTVSATAVVTGVQYEIGRSTAGTGVPPRATRTLNFVLVSSDGAADPVMVS